MKIGFDDLSKDVQDTIRLVRGITSDYKHSDGDALIGYDGERLKIKRNETKKFHKKCTLSDIRDMQNHLYKNDEIYESSFHKDYIGKYISSATRLFKNKLFTEAIVKTVAPTEIRIVKEDNNAFTVLTDNGKIGKFNKSTGKLIYQIDIITELRSKFNLQTLNIFNIQDIEACESGLFIATDLYGIFYFDSVKKTIELKFKELYTLKMKYIGDGSLLCLTRKYISLYNMDSEHRIERYLSLIENQQKPRDIMVKDNFIYVLGKTLTGIGAEESLYIWQKSGPTILHNLSHQVAPNRDDVEYNAKFVEATDTHVYISGQIGHRVFIWKYDRLNLRKEPEEIFLDAEVENLLFCRTMNNMFIYGDREHIYTSELDGTILENFYVDKKIKDIIVSEGTLYIMTADTIERVQLPTYQQENHVHLSLLNDVTYNNVSVLLLGVSNKDEVKLFINNETNSDAFEYVYTDDGLYIKMLTTVLKLAIDLKLHQNTIIKGIIIKKDNIYN